MRYMMIVKADSGEASPNPEMAAAVEKLAEDMTKSGVLLDRGAMQAISTGTVFKLAGGKVSATEGPFTEMNEVVGGYSIYNVESKEEAMKLARQFLEIAAKIMGPHYTTEMEVLRLWP